MVEGVNEKTVYALTKENSQAAHSSRLRWVDIIISILNET
jgi:hypothetical protein